MAAHWLLPILVLFLGLSTIHRPCFVAGQSAPNDCLGSPWKRRNCGYPGINFLACIQRNCCYDSSIPNVNWCFYSLSQNNAQCSVSPPDRKECGYPGIRYKECLSAGCCFDSSLPGVKWCFYPKADASNVCVGSPLKRRNCGYPGIRGPDCAQRNCCYDSSIPNVNWCYYTLSQNNAQCSVNPWDRIECGYPGIREKECLSRGCCYNSNLPGVKWCFNPMANNNAQCSVSPSVRIDCGYPGISDRKCLSRGCCFDSSVHGVTWCFYPKAGSLSSQQLPPALGQAPGQQLPIITAPTMAVVQQLPVGPGSIPAVQPSSIVSGGGPVGSITATHGPTGTGNTRCSVSPQDRTECGYPGISEMDCLSRGCCFNTAIPGVTWCFNPNTGSLSSQQLPPALGQAPGQQLPTITAPTMAVVEQLPVGHGNIAAVQPSSIVSGGGPVGSIIATHGPTGTGNTQCSVSPQDRTDCGYPGISEMDCLSRGCCFNAAIPGVTWCFNPNTGRASNDCAMSPWKRRNCGYPGINASDCAQRNCCYDSSIPNVIWCFYSLSQDNAQCYVSPQDRTDCGSSGISDKECLSRGCCYNANLPGVTWCFHPNTASPLQQPLAAMPPTHGQPPDLQPPAVITSNMGMQPLFGGDTAQEQPSGIASAETVTGECVVAPYKRRDCGYSGISSSECAQRNCCYDSTIPEVSWCYYSLSQGPLQQPLAAIPPTQGQPPDLQPPAVITSNMGMQPLFGGDTAQEQPSGIASAETVTGECVVAPYKRRDCGYSGISSSECTQRNCCYDSTIPEVSWCYYSLSQACNVSPKLRKDCGYPNIGPKDCRSIGCCFDDSIPETIWCFYGNW